MEGVSCEAGKVEAVQNWLTPKTVTELRSFLGYASYYCRFIKGFTKIAGPLHGLVNDSSKSTKKKTAEPMKWALTTAPVLGYTDYTKPFILKTDAS